MAQRPTAWRAIFAALPDDARLDILSSWAENGYLLIVRRYLPAESYDTIPTGVPLSPFLGKQRIAVSFAPEDVGGQVAPLSLRVPGDLAPRAWAETMSALLDLGHRYKAEPHVIGSLLWQQLTGLSYLTETSDLDLLWPCSTVSRPFLKELAVIDGRSPMRLGEVLLADGSAVNWRELHGCLEGTGERTVLVKSVTVIEVQPAAAFLTHGQTP